MNTLIPQFKKVPPLCLTMFALGCFALRAQAVEPATPDMALANGNTADGDSALLGVTGFYNSAFGFLALLSNGAASFNTGVGAGVLLSNTANENTGVGAGALFSNINGDSNTAVGTFALFNENATGGFPNGVSNNAIGRDALFSDTTGSFNEAVGVNALFSNTTGVGDIAVGDDAGFNITGNGNVTVGGGSSAVNTGITSGSNNTVVGNGGGFGITTSSGNVILGAGAGPNVNNLGDDCIYIGAGETSAAFENKTIRIGDANASNPATACFIGGILNNVVIPNIGNTIVTIDPVTGQLGATTDAAAGKVAEQQKKIEEQQESISELKSEMQSMVAQLKEQAAQIQKVSAQLELNKHAPRTVANK